MSFREARVRDAQSTRGRALLRLLRPHHWVKNGFVLLPVPFSLAAGAQLELPRFLAGFAGFCLLNSAVYVLNDIRDAEADRLSPRKRIGVARSLVETLYRRGVAILSEGAVDPRAHREILVACIGQERPEVHRAPKSFHGPRRPVAIREAPLTVGLVRFQARRKVLRAPGGPTRQIRHR